MARQIHETVSEEIRARLHKRFPKAPRWFPAEPETP